MGRLAVVLSFFRTLRNGANVSDVKVDPGGGANATAEHFSSSGDDSQPLPGDYALLVGSTGEGREEVSGYIDPLNAGTAAPGEKRIYARSTSTGDVVASLWLKNTGEVVCSNAAGGSFGLDAAGQFIVNGVVVDLAGLLTATDVTATTNDVTLSTHNHGGSPPTPGS